MHLTKGLALAFLLSALMSAQAGEVPGRADARMSLDARSDPRYHEPLTNIGAPSLGARLVTGFLAAASETDRRTQADAVLSRIWVPGPSPAASAAIREVEAKSRTVEFYSREQTGLGTIRTYVRIRSFSEADMSGAASE